MKNKLILINFVIICMIFGCKGDEHNKDVKMRQVYSKSEKENIINSFEGFKKNLIFELKSTNDLTILTKYFDNEFFLENHFEKGANPNYPETVNFYYNGDDKSFLEIKKRLDIDVIIYIFENGHKVVTSSVASLTTNLSTKNPKKYPGIYFKYNLDKKEWKIKSIEYLRM